MRDVCDQNIPGTFLGEHRASEAKTQKPTMPSVTELSRAFLQGAAPLTGLQAFLRFVEEVRVGGVRHGAPAASILRLLRTSLWRLLGQPPGMHPASVRLHDLIADLQAMSAVYGDRMCIPPCLGPWKAGRWKRPRPEPVPRKLSPPALALILQALSDDSDTEPDAEDSEATVVD